MKRLLVLLLLIPVLQPLAQSLPRSTPETEGVASVGISDFLTAAGTSKNEFHSFMFLRHGKVIAEGWWNPYRADLSHSMYSVSKSFTSTAVGFAISEGKLHLEDKVVSFFPEDLPDHVSPYLAALMVKDMLSMLEGQDPDPTGPVTTNDSNWVKGFLALPIVNRPGEHFLYNTLGVYVLSAIVQKVTGQKIYDYLTPRLFRPLGIAGADWEESPQNINTGGWGLRLKTEDMAKFGQLYLQNGNWNGTQLLPPAWITDATTSKNDEGPGWASHTPRDSSDWRQGYGYLFWRCRHGAFRADGAMGQYIIVMPKEDAVVAITCETPDMQDEINLVWRYLLPSIHNDPLPANPAALDALHRQEAALALPLPPKISNPTLAEQISGKTYYFSSNGEHLHSLTFRFPAEQCLVTRENIDSTIVPGDAVHVAYAPLCFGRGVWAYGETTLRGPYLSNAKTSLTHLAPFETAGSYTWKDSTTLELVLRYIQSPHTQYITCHFDGKKVTVHSTSSLDGGKKEVILEGENRPSPGD